MEIRGIQSAWCVICTVWACEFDYWEKWKKKKKIIFSTIKAFFVFKKLIYYSFRLGFIYLVSSNISLIHLFTLISLLVCLLAPPPPPFPLVVPFSFSPSTLFFIIPIRLFRHPSSPFPTSSFLKPNQAGTRLKKRSVWVHRCMCATERQGGIGRDRERGRRRWGRVQTSLSEGERLDHTDKPISPPSANTEGFVGRG